jgi:transcriptional regulator with XRE-family HTH domain
VKSKFGTNLEMLLKTNRVTPRQLAKEISIPYKTIMDWMAANRMPRDPETLKKITQYFNCSLEFLLFGEESRPLIQDLLEKTEVHTGLYEISIRKVNPKKA